MNTVRLLTNTFAKEVRKTEVQDLLLVGLGTSTLVLGFEVWAGQSEESLRNSVYARRYFSKYYKLRQEELHSQPHAGGH